MGVIGIVLLVTMIISAILLILVVLVQDDQGEGLGGIFGGGSNTAFGSRSGNVLTRFTAVLAAIFLVCCFGMAWLSKSPGQGDVVSKARQEAIGGSAQQSWWVQTSPAPAAGAETGGLNAPQAPAGTPALPQAPAAGSGTQPTSGSGGQ